MTDLIYIIVTGAVSLILGMVLGRLVFSRVNKAEEQKAKESAALTIKEAQVTAEEVKRNKILEAKEKFLKLKTEFEEEANRKKNQIISNENKLKQREQTLSKQIEQSKRKESESDVLKEKLTVQLQKLDSKNQEIDKFNEQKVTILEKISNLTADDAREQLIETLTNEARTKA